MSSQFDNSDHGDETMNPQHSQIKKRKRLPISCTTCRKRKIKCDRQKPLCGACKKNNVPVHLCIYDDSPWISSIVKEENLKNEYGALKSENLRLINLLNSKIRERERERELKQSKGNNNVNSCFPQNNVFAINYDKNNKDNNLKYKIKYKIMNCAIDLTKIALTKIKLNENQISSNFGPLSLSSLLFFKENKFGKLINLFEPLYLKFRNDFKKELLIKESLGSNFFDFFKLSQLLNVDKKYSNIILNINDLKPDKNDIFGKKLQELSKCLPSFKIVEQKFLFFFNLKNSDLFFFQPIVNYKDIKENFYRIFKKTRKGGIEIDVYNDSKDYNMELLHLSGLLLLIKFGLLFSDSDDNFKDSNNSLTSFSMICFLMSNSTSRPSVVSIQVMIMMMIFKKFNPDDSSLNLFVTKTDFDDSLLLTLSINSAKRIGLQKNYANLDPAYKNANNPNNNYIQNEEALKNIWKNLLKLDFEYSIKVGFPLSIKNHLKYDVYTTADIELNLIIFSRFFANRYSIFNENMEFTKILDMKFNKKPEMFRKRIDIENDIINLKKFINNFLSIGHNNYMNENCFEINNDNCIKKINHNLDFLIAIISFSYLLYLSYKYPESPIHVNVEEDDHDDEYASENESMILEELRLKATNDCILYLTYSLKMIDLLMQNFHQNELFVKNKTLQIVAFPNVKKLLLKSVCCMISILIENRDLDDGGICFKYVDNDKDLPREYNLWNYSLEELNDITLQTENSSNNSKVNYLNDALITSFTKTIESIFSNMAKVELLKRDLTWYFFSREVILIVLYLTVIKRKFHKHAGVNQNNSKKYQLQDIFNFKEFSEAKSKYENSDDQINEHKRYSINYILN